MLTVGGAGQQTKSRIGQRAGYGRLPPLPCVQALLALCLSIGVEEAAAQQNQTPVPQTVVPTQQPFTILGFADVDYDSTDSRGKQGFSLGQAVAHVIAPLGQRLNLFSEISLTPHDSGYSIEVERLIIKYDFSNRNTLSAGRYHTPIGYWNTAFHHGTWLQTTVGRPESVKFGSLLVPIHFVGLQFEGKFGGENPNFGYNVGLGNGRHADIARAGDAGDINGNRAWTASVFYQPTWINGLKAGLGAYSDRVTPPGTIEFDEKIYSAYFALERETPEVIAEYIRSEHDVRGGFGSGSADSFYVQVAYRLGANLQRFKPYLRAERDNVGNDDPLLGGLNLDYEGVITGVRFDFTPFAALKFEYHNEKFGNRARDNTLLVQLSVVLARD